MGILPTLVLTSDALSNGTTIVLDSSNGATVCPQKLGGTWTPSINYCAISQTGGLTVSAGTTLQIKSGVRLQDFSGITNDGKIENYGRIDVGAIFTAGLFDNENGGLIFITIGFHPLVVSGTFTNKAGATVTNGGGNITILAGETLDNSGTLQNNGSLTNYGTILNNKNAVFSNAPTDISLGSITNLGQITNNGNMDDQGDLANVYDGVITNNNNFTVYSATIVNNGTIDNFDNMSLLSGSLTVQTSGTMLNEAGWLDFDSHSSASISGDLENGVNAGSKAILSNYGSIQILTGANLTNTGTINNFGSIINGGVFTNFADGTVTNLNTPALGTITNTGLIDNYGALSNAYSIANNGGQIINEEGATITNTGTIANTGGTFTNSHSGTIVNYGSVTNNAESYLDNYGVLKNYAQVTNVGSMNNAGGGTIDNNGGTLYNNGGVLDNFNDGIINNNLASTASSISNNGGTINNYDNGYINNAYQLSTINNNENSFINNNQGGVITIYAGTMNNNEGVLTNDGGAIYNKAGSVINNKGGTIANENNGTLSNQGSIFNYLGGVMNNELGATTTNSGMLQNNGDISNDPATFNNQGTFYNNDSFTNAVGSSINNYGLLNNTATFTNDGSLTSLCDGTITGITAGGSGTTTTQACGTPSITTKGKILYSGSVTINGTSDPLARVTLYDGAKQIGSTVSNSTGNWNLTLTTLTPGKYSFKTQALGIDGNSPKSSASKIELLLGTETVISCNPNPLDNGESTVCTVTVSSIDLVPVGSVSFSANSTGIFNSTSCTLTKINSSGSSCAVLFTPNSTENYTISGSYGGDSDHMGSRGEVQLIVDP